MLTSPCQADVSPHRERLLARKSWEHFNLTFVMSFSRHDSLWKVTDVDEDRKVFENYKHALWFLNESV
jgi:hypothetical protein